MEIIKAYLILIVLASGMHAFLTRTTNLYAIDQHKMLYVWCAFTTIAFLMPYFGGYLFLCALLAAAAPSIIGKREIGTHTAKNKNGRSSVDIRTKMISQNEKRVIFFIGAFAMLPWYSKSIGGIGFNRLININGPMVLSIIVLAPLLFASLSGVKNKSGRMADLFFFSFFALITFLNMRDTTITNGLRVLVMNFVVLFLPYYAISRHLRTIEGLRSAMLVYAIPFGIFGLFALYSMLTHWHPYFSLSKAWGVIDSGIYLRRSGLLRAFMSFPASGPIAFGIFSMIAICFYWGVSASAKQNSEKVTGSDWVMFALLGSCLLASLSRGPWIGMGLAATIFVLLGKNSVSSLIKMFCLGIVGFIALLPTDFGQTLINLLPFMSDGEDVNFTYRQRLVIASLETARQNLWFGDTNYTDTPTMEAMRQGQGIIDVVNSYLQYLLEYGVVGLALISCFYTTVCLGVIQVVRKLKHDETGLLPLGQALAASMASLLFLISSMSLVGAVPVMISILCGMCVAFQRIIEQNPEVLSANVPKGKKRILSKRPIRQHT